MHVPVLVEEVVTALDPRPGKRFIDATFGDGGHARAIAEMVLPGGMVLGIDWDPQQVLKHKDRVEKHIRVIEENYANIERVARQYHVYPADGVIFDLGFSVFHIEHSGKGFSFRKDEPLIMRYASAEKGLTASDIVNEWSEKELERIFQEFGEERYAGRIARALCETRKKKPFRTTVQLADAIMRAIPAAARTMRIHPATRIFQALRIVVNNEFGNMKKGIAGAYNVLGSGGRIVVITFHSLEDRIVKELFRAMCAEGKMRLVNKKVIMPQRGEVVRNPRARSAKLRIAEKI